MLSGYKPKIQINSRVKHKIYSGLFKLLFVIGWLILIFIVKVIIHLGMNTFNNF